MGTKQPSAKYIKFIVYLAAVVLLNLASTTLFFRVDLSENKAYSLSDASKRVVSNLSEPLTIKVFFSNNLPAPYNGTETYLRDLLEEYAAFSNRYFNYRFYDVSADGGDIAPGTGENQKLAENYGIHPIQIQAIDKDEVKFQKVYMGLVLIHGDIIERIPTIADVDGLEYRLTTAIQKLNNKISALLGLKDKIRVRLFLSSSLNAVAPLMGLNGLSNLPREVQAVVDTLNTKNYGKIAYEYLDPTKDPGLDAEANKYSVLQLSWAADAGRDIPEGSGVSGLVISHGEKAVTVPLIQVVRLPLIGTQYSLTAVDQIEEAIDGTLAGLIGIHENLGVLTGHGELNISGMAAPPAPGQQPDGVESLRSLIQQNYTIQDVKLADEIPASVQCLLVAGPKKKFSDYDLFKIDQFLMQGKNVAFFLDAFEEIMPQQGMMGGGQPQYLPVDTGLDRLLGHYGVRMKPAYVMDENCFTQRIPEQMGGGQRKIYFAPLIKNENIDKMLNFMRNIKGLVTLKAAPLALLEDRVKESGVSALRLFSSSERSWEMADRINLNPMFLQPPPSSQDMQRFPLAYLLEGVFTSYFSGKPIPEKPQAENPAGDGLEDQPNGDEKDSETGPADPTAASGAMEKSAAASVVPAIEEKGAVIAKGKPGKIIIVGSSEMLRDSLLAEDGRDPNAIFVMNIMDYLNNRDDIAVMRSKEQRFNPLADTTPGAKAVVKALNIAGLPLVVVLFGLLVWNRRHAKKKRIQMMFQK